MKGRQSASLFSAEAENTNRTGQRCGRCLPSLSLSVPGPAPARAAEDDTQEFEESVCHYKLTFSLASSLSLSSGTFCLSSVLQECDFGGRKNTEKRHCWKASPDPSPGSSGTLRGCSSQPVGPAQSIISVSFIRTTKRDVNPQIAQFQLDSPIASIHLNGRNVLFAIKKK